MIYRPTMRSHRRPKCVGALLSARQPPPKMPRRSLSQSARLKETEASNCVEIRRYARKMSRSAWVPSMCWLLSPVGRHIWSFRCGTSSTRTVWAKCRPSYKTLCFWQLFSTRVLTRLSTGASTLRHWLPPIMASGWILKSEGRTNISKWTLRFERRGLCHR